MPHHDMPNEKDNKKLPCLIDTLTHAEKCRPLAAEGITELKILQFSLHFHLLATPLKTN